MLNLYAPRMGFELDGSSTISIPFRWKDALELDLRPSRVRKIIRRFVTLSDSLTGLLRQKFVAGAGP